MGTGEAQKQCFLIFMLSIPDEQAFKTISMLPVNPVCQECSRNCGISKWTKMPALTHKMPNPLVGWAGTGQYEAMQTKIGELKISKTWIVYFVQVAPCKHQTGSLQIRTGIMRMC